MKQNKLLNEAPEQVVVFPQPRIIEITGAHPERAYGLFDSETGTQVTGFKKGTEGKVEFKGLAANKHYDVGVIEGMEDEKPYFAIAWTRPMKDNTDDFLNNSDNLPVIYPCRYLIKDKENSYKNTFDLVDDNGETVGQVINLSQQGDKPRFNMVCTFKMKDDTQK